MGSARKKTLKLELESVYPLLEYLDHLPQEQQDRELTWAEDEGAIFILKTLCPPDLEYLQCCLEGFIDANARDERTLSAWYSMARHVAQHIQLGE